MVVTGLPGSTSLQAEKREKKTKIASAKPPLVEALMRLQNSYFCAMLDLLGAINPVCAFFPRVYYSVLRTTTTTITVHSTQYSTVHIIVLHYTTLYYTTPHLYS